MAMFNTKCSGVNSSPIGSPGGTVANKIMKETVKNMKIGTWNARSVFVPGKLDNIVKEMLRLDVDILGVGDVRWPGSGSCTTGNGTFYYSGNNDPKHLYGVGVILNGKFTGSVLSFTPCSDRVIMLQLKTHTGIMNIIQVYAPTTDKEDDEVEEFYAELDDIFKSIKNSDITVVMGDFNAKVGKDKVEAVTGGFGLGERNSRGDRMVEFCQVRDLMIANTFFKLPDRRLYTWKSPKDSPGNRVRNQIDYILVNNRYRNSVKAAKTYPGADINSDHNPVIAKLNVRMKTIKKRINKYTDPKILKNSKIHDAVKKEVNECMRDIDTSEELSVDKKWKQIQTKLETITEKHLRSKRTKKKQWMTSEILDLMEERRNSKGNKDEYRTINKVVQKKIKEAKEEYLAAQCEEIEELEKKYDSFHMHKKIKEMAGCNRVNTARNSIKDTNGRIITDVGDKLKMWKTYLAELFDDERPPKPVLESNNVHLKILKSEIVYALETMKAGKAPGPDCIPIELIKLFDDDVIDILLDLFNRIYDRGEIPKQWLLSTFVLIPKKPNPRECSDYRTIALMSHTLKLFLKIIHKRIYRKLEEEISSTQFGFREGLGTREALFGINVLFQRCLDINQEVYACYIDFEKAFDKVKHDKLHQLLVSKNIDSDDVRIISNLYWDQKANTMVENQQTEEIEIRRGVRQGCILSPLLFNLYSEAIFRETLEDELVGIVINGEIINNMRYADDTVLLTTNLEDTQHLLEKLNDRCNEYGLKINFKKTKLMVVTKCPQGLNQVNLTVANTTIENVSAYKYLGTWIEQSGDQTREIKTRIEIARSTFVKMKKLFTSRDINIGLRMRMLRCYVFSTLLYGVEAWTLKKNHIDKLQAFETWCYRRMWRIPWTDRVSNAEVLDRMQKECEIINTMKRRKLQYLGHIMRGQKYTLLQLIVQGKISGKRSIGRRRVSWLRNLRDWFNCSNVQLFRAAVNKVRIAVMIANLR